MDKHNQQSSVLHRPSVSETLVYKVVGFSAKDGHQGCFITSDAAWRVSYPLSDLPTGTNPE